MGTVREEKRRERVRRKKMQVREKVEKSRLTVFLPMICGPGGSKSRLAKAAGAEPCGQMKDEKLHVIVVRSAFLSQNVQNTLTSDHFCKLRCRKKCTPLWREAPSPSQKCKKLTGSEHFWKLRCSKSARRCGTKHISKPKAQKKMRGTGHFWTFRCRFAWQAQGIVHLVKTEQNMRVLWHFQN